MKIYMCIKDFAMETVDGDCCSTGKDYFVNKGSIWHETEQRFKECEIWLSNEDGTMEIGLCDLDDFEELFLCPCYGKEKYTMKSYPKAKKYCQLTKGHGELYENWEDCYVNQETDYCYKIRRKKDEGKNRITM